MAIDDITRDNIKLLVLCTVGLVLSVYTYHVEATKQKDESYKAYCDIADHISCSRVFTSKYGKGLGGIMPADSIFHVPNCLFGIGFYCLVPILALWNTRTTSIIILFMAGISNFLSLFFAYLLLFVLVDFCVVCVTIYVINFSIFIILYAKDEKLSFADESNDKKVN